MLGLVQRSCFFTKESIQKSITRCCATPNTYSLQQHIRGYKNYPIKLLVQNHVAKKRYKVLKELEVGIMLETSELKSILEKRIDLSAATVDVYKGELFLHQAHIPEYKNGWAGYHDPYRVRKLLAHKREINRFESFLQSSNAILVPLRVHVGKTLKIKIVVGQCEKGDRVDKREHEKRKEARSSIRGAMKD